MSTDSEVTSIDPASPRTGQQPGALVLLTATVLGGIAASRLPKGPLVLAAGATAFALLKQKKKPATPQVPAPSPFAPAPPAEMLPQSQVEQWLQQQIDREAESPVISFPADEPAAALPEDEEPAAFASFPPPEDDYTPQSLLMDDFEAHEPLSVPHEAFASLTEPVACVTAPVSAPATGHEPDLVPVLRALEATESSPAANAAWLLGIEPVPSLSEPAAPATAEERISFFTDAPAAPPVFTTPVFEGASLPDEIEVASPPAEAEPLAHLLPVSGTPVSLNAEHPQEPSESTKGKEPETDFLNPPPPFFSAKGTDPLTEAFVFSSLATQSGERPQEMESPIDSPAPASASPSAPAVFPFTLPLTHSTELPSIFSSTPSATSPLFPSPPHASPALSSPFSSPSTPAPADESIVGKEQEKRDDVIEIPVQLAAPGEASFDPPPLVTSSHNPWQPPAESEPPPSQPASAARQSVIPIVDAEIVLRPRAPVQSAVVAKPVPASAPEEPAVVSDTAESPSPPPPLPGKRPRSIWRSWWRGD